MTVLLTIILAFGGLLAFANAATLIGAVMSKRSTSFMPVLGGLLIAISAFFLFGPVFALLGLLDFTFAWGLVAIPVWLFKRITG